MPFVQALQNKKSKAFKKVKGTESYFDKFQQTLFHILSKIEGTEIPFEHLLNFFEDSNEVALAIII